ncbi:MAG: tRNA uridine-5-carboxymethylaminomethyl(34) synthesis GTPase MnmE [Bacteroidales bacterium]|nr:tRNA uridine-5-carboxymethylaminomethyl(34) synthesis GTPase MnmE [Bacteroidales bacterium]
MFDDTITATATPPGSGAIAVIRLSGEKSFEIIGKIFKPKKGKKEFNPYSIRFGTINDNNEIIDEVLISIFKSPHSYTGEDSVEISCHGSLFIQQKILNLLIKSGARLANPGEFTQRAYLNGKMDLSQAEAVADLIASESAAAHKVALQQMRGGFSSDLQKLRSRLLSFITLIELELDFSEEDVEFADKKELKKLIVEIQKHISELINSFELGNVIKKGIPVAIVGEPNVGKSTLLNVLLNEDKAIVSDIAGTTRDAVEDIISIKGILFRLIDTAGIRKTEDTVEALGIERTMDKIKKSDIVLFMINAGDPDAEKKISEMQNKTKNKHLIVVINKIDTNKPEKMLYKVSGGDIKYIEISAKHKINIDKLNELLIETVNYSSLNRNDTIITNSRHLAALQNAYQSSLRVSEGLGKNISGEFLAQDIREILQYIGEITGEYTTDEVLGNIFSNFCIGK